MVSISWNRSALAVALLALLGLAAAPPPAAAAVFFVTKTADTLDGACDADCSLREAIVAATALPGADVIVLGAGTYTLTRAGAGEDAAATGDLDVTGDLSILGAGAASTVLDGGLLDRVLDVAAGVRLEMVGVTVHGGKVADVGGGIRNAGTLVLTRCAVSGNTTTGGAGGGIWSDAAGSALAITASTISGNTAAGNGGGIAAGGTMTLADATVSGNASSTGAGGGLYLFAEISATIDNATITANTAAHPGGGAFVEGAPFISDHRAEFRNTIVAANGAPSQPDCSGSAFSGGYNLIGDGNGCSDFKSATHDQEGTAPALLDPRLGPLAQNGGPTLTHALLPTSPAVDAGDPDPAGSGGQSCEALDQRGQPRPGRCDVGAFELGEGCAPGPVALCLSKSRFQVTVAWRTPQGQSGNGQAVPLSADSGYFWFFDPANVELTVKVLDACGPFGRFWVFLSGLTNVQVDVTVFDTVSGYTRVYHNPQKTVFQTKLDTDAFETCGL